MPVSKSPMPCTRFANCPRALLTVPPMEAMSLALLPITVAMASSWFTFSRMRFTSSKNPFNPSAPVAPALLNAWNALYVASAWSLAAFCISAAVFMACVAKKVSPAVTPLINAPPGTSKLNATAAICVASVMASMPSLNCDAPFCPLAMASVYFNWALYSFSMIWRAVAVSPATLASTSAALSVSAVAFRCASE